MKRPTASPTKQGKENTRSKATAGTENPLGPLTTNVKPPIYAISDPNDVGKESEAQSLKKLPKFSVVDRREPGKTAGGTDKAPEKKLSLAQHIISSFGRDKQLSKKKDTFVGYSKHTTASPQKSKSPERKKLYTPERVPIDYEEALKFPQIEGQEDTPQKAIEKLLDTSKQQDSHSRETIAYGGDEDEKLEAQEKLLQNFDDELRKLRKPVQGEPETLQLKREIEQKLQENEQQEKTFTQTIRGNPMEIRSIANEIAEKPFSEDPKRVLTLAQTIANIKGAVLDVTETLKGDLEEKINEVEDYYRNKQQEVAAILSWEPEINLPKSSKRRRHSASKSSKNTLFKEKEVQKFFGVVTPPPILNSYMLNEYFMKKRPQSRYVKVKKTEDKKTYAEKFLDYIDQKKARLEMQPEPAKKPDFDRFVCTSANRTRARTANKWDPDNLIENEEKPNLQREIEQLKRQREMAEAKSDSKILGASKISEGRLSHQRLGGSSVSGEKPRGRERESTGGLGKKTSPILREVAHTESNDGLQPPQEQVREIVYDDEIFTAEDVRLLQFVYSVIKKDYLGNISKSKFLNFVLKSPVLMEVFDIVPKEFRNTVTHLETIIDDSIAFEEFLDVFADLKRAGMERREENGAPPIPKIKFIEDEADQAEPNPEGLKVVTAEMILKKPEEKKSIYKVHVEETFANPCLLPDDVLELFGRVYDSIDPEGTDAVPRVELVEAIRNDMEASAWLDAPAVYYEENDTKLTVARILYQIEQEALTYDGEEAENKRNISKKTFLKYFTNYKIQRGLSPRAKEAIRKGRLELEEDDDQEVIDIHTEIQNLLRDKFEELPKRAGIYVELEAYIQAVNDDPRYEVFRGEIGRKKAKRGELEEETVAAVIERLHEEGDNFIEWPDIMDFFTRRGRPKAVIQRMSARAEDPFHNLGKGTKKTTFRDYDSEPEFSRHEEEEPIDYFEEYQAQIVTNFSPSRSSKVKWMTYKRDAKEPLANIPQRAQEQAEDESVEEPKSYKKLKAEQERAKLKASQQQQALQTAIFGKKFGAIYKDDFDFRFTTPNPFKFDEREKSRKKTIRERRLEEMILEIQAKELRNRNHIFRAKAIPITTLMPLYEKIMMEQEQRREYVRENSKAITTKREKPFSFYKRDYENYVMKKEHEASLSEEFNVRFKAKPIPQTSLITNLWEQLQEQWAAESRERVRRRAEENMVKASLPPRMESYKRFLEEKANQEKENEKKQLREARQRKPFVAKEIPDFEKAHRAFQELLDQKKQSFKPTVPEGFAFQETKKGVTREYLDAENQFKRTGTEGIPKRDPFEAVERLKQIQPKYQPPTTKKMLALMDLRRAEREEEERKAQQKLREAEEREERRRRLAPRVQHSPAIEDRTAEQKESAARIKQMVQQKFREDHEHFMMMKAEIERRLEERPLLVEQEAEKARRMQLQAMEEYEQMGMEHGGYPEQIEEGEEYAEYDEEEQEPMDDEIEEEDENQQDDY